VSGANYIWCEHCDKKVFYTGDTDYGDAVVFHAACLGERDMATAFDALRFYAAQPLDPADGVRPFVSWADVRANVDQWIERLEAGS
jgi:hypothetical protein